MSKYERFGKYILLEKIAAGGMAEVYLAKSAGANGVNKFLAIKRILPQFSNNEEFIAMFQEEAKVSVNLNHSNVVSIYDFGIESGQFYIVMEFVEGRNLRQIINEIKKNNKSLKIEESVYIIKEAAAGLDHAHRCTDQKTGRPLNITHRDMSPQNIMISFEGEAKVIDFGIAKQSEGDKEETRAGTLKGKFAYMSPEQAEAEEVDPRTDVFALGIILWELLANDRLFTGSNENAILRKVRECQIPSIRKINPLVPAELERIVTKALSKERNNRYQTAANLQKELNRFLNTQYPDFSPQDFSKTIIDCFKYAFQEGRDKLVTYSKIDLEVNFSDSEKNNEKMTSDTNINPQKPIPQNQDLPPVPQQQAQQLQNKTLHAAPPSETEIGAPKIELEGLKDAVNSFNAKKNNHRNLNNKTVNLSSIHSGARSGENTSKTHLSHIQPIYQNYKPEKNFDVAIKLFVIVFMIIGSYFGYSKFASQKINSRNNTNTTRIQPPINKDKGPKLPNEGKIELAAKASVKVSISSDPSGAQIFVDGIDTQRTTPAIVSVPANVEANLKLKMTENYYDYELKKVFKDAESLTLSLQKLPKSGFLNVSVLNGGANPVLYINGRRLTENPPLKKYKVAPDTELVIQAINPITQLKDEVRVTVAPDAEKNVELLLGRTK